MKTSDSPSHARLKKRTPPTLERGAEVPLYRQLSECLRSRIREDDWSENRPFLTEVEIAEIWSVSPYTVRQALGLLVDEGLLVRERGRGTFVRPNAGQPQVQPTKQVQYNRIALVMPWDRDSFFSRMFIDVESMAHDAGLHTMLVNNWNDADTEVERVREVVEHGVDGLIWMCSADGPKPTALRYATEKTKAMVLVDRAPDSLENQVSLVTADNFGGMASVVQYLLDKGHRRIFMASAQRQFSSTRNRENGYRQTLIRNGFNAPGEWIFGTRSIGFEAGKILAQKILRSNMDYDAICCSTDSVAVGLIREFEKHGLSVPRDVSVTGFDDDPICSIFKPALTTVHMEVPLIAQEATRLLLSNLQRSLANEVVTVSRISVPVRLIARDSA